MGEASDLTLPTSSSNSTINLNADAHLSADNACGAFNPALSITNKFNDLKDNMNNIGESILKNATGSIAQMPMYFLAQLNPTAYGKQPYYRTFLGIYYFVIIIGCRVFSDLAGVY